MDFLKGKKTYIIGAIAFVTAGLGAIGVTIPVWVPLMLGSLGLGTLRAGMNK